MSILSRLFGSGSDNGSGSGPEHDPVDYKGFTIHPDPIKEGGSWRVAARIEKDVEGETMSHHLIRADMINNLEQAVVECARKAQRLIDERGEGLFDRPH
ncbi:MAG: HlyU family transcriptional regulator [Roseovarius sp.]